MRPAPINIGKLGHRDVLMSFHVQPRPVSWISIPLHPSLQFCFHCARCLQVGQCPDSREQDLICHGRVASSQLLKCGQCITSGRNLQMHLSAQEKTGDPMAARAAFGGDELLVPQAAADV